MRDWVTNVGDTYYLLGSALGLASLSDDGARFSQGDRRRGARGRSWKPRAGCPIPLIACVGGGSNAIGLFHAFIPDAAVELIGVEAGGRGDKLGEHAARYRGGAPGVLQGAYSYRAAG